MLRGTAHWNSFTETNRGISGKWAEPGRHQTKIAEKPHALWHFISMHPYAPYQMVPWPVFAQIIRSDHLVLLIQPVRHSSRCLKYVAQLCLTKSMKIVAKHPGTRRCKGCQNDSKRIWAKRCYTSSFASKLMVMTIFPSTHCIKTCPQNKCWSYLIRLPIHSKKHIPTEKCPVPLWFPCLILPKNPGLKKLYQHRPR